MPTDEREITEPVDLCTPDGRLDPAAVGWTRRPLHRASQTHQCSGEFTGWAMTNDGERVDLGGLVGWAEEARNRGVTPQP